MRYVWRLVMNIKQIIIKRWKENCPENYEITKMEDEVATNYSPMK